MARLNRVLLIWLGRKRLVTGPASLDAPSFLGELPGQRRTTREADLSTQQIGAQAPSRISRPPCDRWWPQGARRPPRARPEASERLNGPPEIASWIGYGSGRTSSPLP